MAAGADKAVSTLCDPSRDLFAPDQAASPYLVDWRQAFGALPASQAQPAALAFDRSPFPPVVERFPLPRDMTPRCRQLVALHLSARINNVLCTAGAHTATIIAPEGLDPAILAAVRRNLLARPDDFSNMSLHFLHGLIASTFGRTLAIEAAPAGQALPEASSWTLATSPARRPAQARPGLALAVNIGQHLTSFGLVRLGPDGSCTIDTLSRWETCADLTTCCLTEEIVSLMDAIRANLGSTADRVEAVGLSVAATVCDGLIRPVAEFGLFAACPPYALDHTARAIPRAAAQAFPGRSVAVVNDAKAQALFAFHFAGGTQAAQGNHLLAVRLGACPCVHCLDAAGMSPAGFDEYGWLAVRACPTRPGGPLFSTPRHPLSHYGVAAAAHELGLLDHYGLGIEDAIPFFHARLTGDAPQAAREAAGIYRLIGANLAMLAAEIHAGRPLGAVLLMGSRANRLDGPAFAAISDGYAAFAAGRPLVPADARRVLVQDASADAALIGAAIAALAPDDSF
jgi:hypothetical protein